MKKTVLLVAVVLAAVALSSCGSLRTPSTGKRANKVYYNTVFGLSIESGVYGDGFIVDQK